MIREENFSKNENVDLPLMQSRKCNRQTALSKPRPQPQPKTKKQLLQDFWQACNWRQLKRRAQPKEIMLVVKNNYGKIGILAIIIILTFKMNVPVAENNTQLTENQLIEQSAIFSLPDEAPTAILANNIQNEAQNTIILSRLENINAETKKYFLKRFVKVAQSEQQKFKIPASICLAFSILYSGFDTNEISQNYQNYFHLSCQELTSKNAQTVDYQGECLLKFETAWAGFRAQSEFLIANYGDLPETAGEDCQLWLIGLQRLGYEKTAFSVELLSEIISIYDLQKYDK